MMDGKFRMLNCGYLKYSFRCFSLGHNLWRFGVATGGNDANKLIFGHALRLLQRSNFRCP